MSNKLNSRAPANPMIVCKIHLIVIWPPYGEKKSVFAWVQTIRKVIGRGGEFSSRMNFC